MIHYEDESVRLHHGDCLDILATLPDASVDAVVTDPPYALEFMGQSWDGWSTPRAFQEWCELWAAECLRILKPGGHMVAFGGSRTWHRLAAAVEDAGFEIRDSIAWLYGSGFPKSLDVSKAIDKARNDRPDILQVTGWLAEQRDRAGLTNRQIDEAFGFSGMAGHWTAAPHLKIAAVPTWEQWQQLRELIGFADEMDAEVWRLNGRKGTPGEAFQTAEVVGERTTGLGTGRGAVSVIGDGDRAIRAANSDAARQWQGWGTALKPAFEPIVVGRKPLTGTVAANVLKYGTGALNIDGCRVGTELITQHGRGGGSNTSMSGRNYAEPAGRSWAGRWPANVILDESQAAELDEQTGVLTSGANPTRRGSDKFRDAYGEFKGQAELTPARGADSGGASRFFPTFRYEAKAPTAERPTYYTHSCNCEDPWPTHARGRATSATTSPADSSMSKSGNGTTGDPSRADTTSTTSTSTSRTTTPRTSSSSPSSSTSGSTPAASSAMESGGSPAASATSSSPSGLTTGTSAAKAGRSTGAADRATSHAWSATSVCGSCGAPARREAHATVKPLDLMRWLVRLVTPPGGTVLEPFAGSGTTAEACVVEGFQCIAIEKHADYLPLIVARLTKPIEMVLDFGEAS